MTWHGADPGGIGRFGVAALKDDGSFETACLSSVEEALAFLAHATSIGIDCPLWWCSRRGGGRKVDQWLRDTYQIHPGTVQPTNALRGAVVVQGMMLAMQLRKQNPSIEISEAHPKALIMALGLPAWSDIAQQFKLNGMEPAEHERDALLGAVVAREGARGSWRDLSLGHGPGELDPKSMWFGPVNYWWPNDGHPLR